MLDNQTVITKILKKSIEQERQLLRNFSRLSLEIKLQIFDLQKSLFHKIKQNNNNISNNILSYCSLVLAIDETIKSDEKLDIKAFAVKFKTQVQNSKRDRILELWAIVKVLKIDQNLSFRQIATYLKKHHKLEVVHSTLHKMWNELEK